MKPPRQESQDAYIDSPGSRVYTMRNICAYPITVVTFPGALDDQDDAKAVRLVGAEAVPLWHAEHDLKGVDAVFLPGGFSYGDYLRGIPALSFAGQQGA